MTSSEDWVARQNNRTPMIDQREQDLERWAAARWPSMTVHRVGMHRLDEDVPAAQRAADSFRESARWCDYAVGASTWIPNTQLDARITWLIDVKAMGLRKQAGLVVKRRDLHKARQLSDELAQARWTDAGSPEDRPWTEFAGSYYFAVMTMKREEHALALLPLAWVEQQLRPLDPLYRNEDKGLQYMLHASDLLQRSWFSLDPSRCTESVSAPPSVRKAAKRRPPRRPAPKGPLEALALYECLSKARRLEGDELRHELALAAEAASTMIPAPLTDRRAQEHLADLWHLQDRRAVLS